MLNVTEMAKVAMERKQETVHKLSNIFDSLSDL